MIIWGCSKCKLIAIVKESEFNIVGRVMKKHVKKHLELDKRYGVKNQ